MNKDTKIIPATIERDGEIYVHVSDILTEKEINGKLQQELERYKNIIDKAIEYINKSEYATIESYKHIHADGDGKVYNLDILLNILKGSDE